MTTETTLRRAMLAVAALMAAGTLGELVLTEHTGGAVQWVPFVLLVTMAAAIAAAALAPGRSTRLALRIVSGLLVVGSAFGVWEHLEHNYAFEAEIRPDSPGSTLVFEAIFGASPLLAPGVVGVIGLLAAAATLGDRRA